MTEPLEPTTATYIKLVYVLRQAVADGSDPDNLPDWLPMPEGTTGIIQYPVKKIMAPSANPPVTFYPKDIPVTFDDTTGEMLDDQGNPGVWVVNPLNPAHQPHGFTLSFVLTVPNEGTEKFSIGIVNQSGADTYDITLNSPVPGSAGESVTMGSPGPGLEFQWDDDQLQVRQEGKTNWESSPHLSGGPGDPGTAATVSVDPASTTVPYGTSTSVTNTGTANAAVLKFLIEQAQPGSQIITSAGAPTGTAPEGSLHLNTITGDVHQYVSGNWSTQSIGNFTGPQGIPGPLGLTWRGEWSTGNAYVVRDAVQSNGSAYICKIAVPVNGGEPSTDTTHWDLLAAKGSSGLGSGDVSGPSSSTSGHVATFNGTDGKSLSDGGPLPVGVPDGGNEGDVLQRTSSGLVWGTALSSVTSEDITDATSVGKDVLTATDAGAARTAIGAGTSSFDGSYTSLSNKPIVPTWSTLEGKPAVVAAGTDAAEARSFIGAGTSDFSGSYDDLSNKPAPGLSATGDNPLASIWTGTQAQYDALTPDPSTLYIVTGA